MWALENENIIEFLGQLHCSDARAWLAEVMSSLKQDEITRVVVRLWAIRFARRKAIHENQFQSPFSTHTFVEQFIGELEEINQESPEVRPVPAPVPRWVRPPSGLAKINVDAAMSKNSGQAAAVAVARDDVGNYLGSSALVVEGHTGPEVMEAVACREGLALASDLGLQSFRIASDCANVVRSLLGEGFGRYGPIVW
jgi:hypothetical protein